MALKIRRGTEAQRSSTTFALGEIAWTTDTYRLYVGDGIQPGGFNIGQNLAGTGLIFNSQTDRLDVNYNGLNSDQITEGSNNKFFANELAQAAVGTALLDGNLYSDGISFSYDDVNARITANISVGAGLPPVANNAGKYLKTDGTTASWAVIDAVGIASVSADTSPSLGGDLDLSSFDITGTGNVDITGNITASQLTVSSLVLNGQTNVSGGPLNFIGVSSNFINTNPTPGTTFVSFLTASATSTVAPLSFAKSRGSLFSPAVVQNGDELASLVPAGYSGSAFTAASSIKCLVDGTVSAGVVPAKWTISVSNSTGVDTLAMTIKSSVVEFSAVPKVPVFANDTARDAAITSPQVGMIIVNGSTFQGWNGAGWSALG